MLKFPTYGANCELDESYLETIVASVFPLAIIDRSMLKTCNGCTAAELQILLRQLLMV